VTPQHLDRLSAIDAGFLAQEKPNTHMHIGGLVLLDGPPPPLADFLAHVRSRLHLVPRYRQKLAFPPIEAGKPVWIDDPTFNLEYHVRHTAMPAPGDEATLLRLAGRIFSQRLDRSKPLWELWLVEGLADGGFALISKSHHALVDGVSGADLGTVLFDVSAEGTELPAPPPWVPKPEPTSADLVARGVQGAVRRTTDLISGALSYATRPEELLARVREVAEGIGEVAMTALSPPSATPFNVAPGPHRRLCVVHAELDEFKEVKSVLGGTVNDVVLAVVAGGLAHFMRGRDWDTDGLELRACVPVSTRSDDQRGALGNQITIMMAPLPVDVADPMARLQRVRQVMDGLKESKQALGANAISNLQDFAPPTIFAQASRLNFSSRMYNLLVTNVPGPQFPLYVLGRRMQRIFPVPFLAGERSLAIAIMSYDGGMDFGLLGDYDAMSDLDVLAEGIEGALAELLLLARRHKRIEQRKSKRRPSSGSAPARPSGRAGKDR
jgi:diacylglycerol O-acyltransferase / wax synthase